MTPESLFFPFFLVGFLLGGACTRQICRRPKTPAAEVPPEQPDTASAHPELVQYLLERVEGEMKSQHPAYAQVTGGPLSASWRFPDFTIIWARQGTWVTVTERPHWQLTLEPGSILEKSVHARWPSNCIPAEIAADAWLVATLRDRAEAHRRSFPP